MKPLLSPIERGLLIVGVCLLLLGNGKAQAATDYTLGLHLASMHVPARDGQNNSNPGVYLRNSSGQMLGAYRNTLNRTSVYAGQVFAVGPVDIGVGVVSGYQRRCHDEPVLIGTTVPPTKHLPGTPSPAPQPVYEQRQICSGTSRGYLTPMVAPSIALPFAVLGATPRLWLLPGLAGTSNVIHLSLESRF